MVESTGTWEVSIGYVLVAVPRRRGSTSLRRPIDARGVRAVGTVLSPFWANNEEPGVAEEALWR
ncbi:extensin [Iris pallida]|uniref:Extensin n=1 Tax=Iris pallida TaxID=29817 RepID=A0AAX6H0T5_IRIPA|nr:extensin [Iris pallida]KAJ6836510.1 extensin [Iris pallida]